MTGDLMTAAKRKPPEGKVTAADVRVALRRRWGGQEATVVFEVAQGTGSHANRHLDAIAMELWPSRGLSIHGIEIKVNLYDWRREKANPAKAEEIARFCDYFWIAAPAKVVPLDELPSAWGLLELCADGRLIVAKQAVKTDAQALTRNFLAAMMRAASRSLDPNDVDAALAQRSKDLEENFKTRVKEVAQLELGQRNEDAEQWRMLMDVLKEKPGEYLYSPEVIAAVRFVLKTNFVRSYDSVRSIHDHLMQAAVAIGERLDVLQVPSTDETKKLWEKLGKWR